MYRYLFCCRSVNPFLRKALIFVVTSHYTRLTTLPRVANMRLAGTKRELARNAVLSAGLSGFSLAHTDEHIASPETYHNKRTSDDEGGNSATKTTVHRTV